MKKPLAVSLICGVVLSGWPGPVFAAKVRVPAGTAVLLRTIADVTPENVLADVVTLSVVQDVVIGGKKVVAAGATGQAEVTSIMKRGFLGTAAKIVITARRVNATDGNTLTIGNSKIVEGNSRMACSVIGAFICLIPALIKGGDAKIPSGAVMDTVTTAPFEVDVKE